VDAGPDATQIRRNWSVPALLASNLCSSAAMVGLTTIVGKQVYDITGRSLDLGLLGLVVFAPAALLVLVTGGVADRFDRRRVSAVAAIGQGASAGALALSIGPNPTSVAPIFILVFAFGVFRAFHAPSNRALPADIVGEERVPWVVARRSGVAQVGTVVGPDLAGWLYSVDVRAPYLAVLILFVLAAVTILQAHPAADQRVAPAPAGPPARASVPESLVDGEARFDAAIESGSPDSEGRPPRPTWSEAIEGLRFIRHRPILVGALSLDLFAVLFGGAIALLPAIATDRLGLDAVGLGWLRAAGGLGASAVMVKLAVRPVTRRVGRTLLMAVAAFGLGTIALGLTRNFAVAFVAMAVLSGADSFSVFIRATLVPLLTPPDKRGRVLAVETLFVGGSNELGSLESGIAGQLLGPAGAVVLGGFATMAVAAGWWVLFPALRDVDGYPGWASEDDP